MTDYHKFRSAWKDFDISARGSLSLNQVRQLMLAVGPPFGFDEAESYIQWLSIREDIVETISPGTHLDIDLPEQLQKHIKVDMEVASSAVNQGTEGSRGRCCGISRNRSHRGPQVSFKMLIYVL